MSSGVAVSGQMIMLVFLVLVSIALLVLVIVLFVRLNREKRRMDRFLTGEGGEDIEKEIEEKFRLLKQLEENDKLRAQDIQKLENRFLGVYQKTGIVKYDAFTENGGKLSFAMALLDGNNSGLVMNVMNSSEGSYCYVKEIRKGASETPLGKEEAQALSIAIDGKRNVYVRH